MDDLKLSYIIAKIYRSNERTSKIKCEKFEYSHTLKLSFIFLHISFYHFLGNILYINK